MTPIAFPEPFVSWLSLSMGTAAGEELESLRERIAQRVDAWQLQIGDGGQLRHGANAVVLDVVHDGEPAVLKVSVRDWDQRPEAAALKWWDGRGAVRLLGADMASNAMLLERLDASRPLSDVPLGESLPLIADVLRGLTRGRPTAFNAPSTDGIASTIRDTLRERNNSVGTPIPEGHLVGLEDLADRVIGRGGEHLVHGDLHAGNILWSPGRRTWVAIDPKPAIGAAELAIPEMIWTRVDEMTDDGIGSAIAAIAQMAGLDPALAREWTLLRSADYLLWALDNGLTEDPVRCTRMLDVLMR